MKRRPKSWYVQSGVLAYRREAGDIRLVLVTSTKKRKWVIPKGIVEDGLDPADSALKEALEEAGVVGKIVREPAGAYSYEKWGGSCTVEVFPMLIERVLDSWPESHIRERTFVAPEEACRLLDDGELKGIIQRYFVRKD